jgi:hypothetical protein
MPITMSKVFMASTYLPWVSVLGIMNLLFEETGILFEKSSFSEVYSPSDEDLIAFRMSSGLRS